jgi:neutral ceramidase
VVCDLLGLHRSVSLEARRLIQEATGIPPENVMISATHTHSAGSALGSSRYVNEQKLDDYQLFLARRISDGVRRALNGRRPAEVAFGSVDVPDHLLNRRWFVRDGKGPVNPFGKVERVWKTGAPGPEFTEPAGPVDPAVSFIALREPGGRAISVYAAYSLHYVGDTGPAHISADYFGMFCEALKRLQSKPEDDPPFVALMANATSGDVGLNQARYNRMNITKGSYQRSRIVANDLAEKVHGALARVTWKDHAELDVRFREPDIAWRKIEPELLVWAKVVEAKAPRLSGGNLPIGANWATTPDWVTRLSYAGRVQALAKVTEPAKVPLQVLRIGDICIGTSPCETYAEIGLEFKQRSPFAQSFMVELNHGMIVSSSSPPTAAPSVLHGGVEPRHDRLPADAAPIRIRRILDLAGHQQPRTPGYRKDARRPRGDGHRTQARSPVAQYVVSSHRDNIDQPTCAGFLKTTGTTRIS